jgi:hypothetical protein
VAFLSAGDVLFLRKSASVHSYPINLAPGSASGWAAVEDGIKSDSGDSHRLTSMLFLDESGDPHSRNRGSPIYLIRVPRSPDLRKSASVNSHPMDCPAPLISTLPATTSCLEWGEQHGLVGKSTPLPSRYLRIQKGECWTYVCSLWWCVSVLSLEAFLDLIPLRVSTPLCPLPSRRHLSQGSTLEILQGQNDGLLQNRVQGPISGQGSI